jgi:hypothetical protein
MSDLGPARLGDLVVAVGAFAHEEHLPGEVGVVGARRGAGGHDREAVAGIRSDRRDDDLGRLGEFAHGFGIAGVGFDDRPVVGERGQGRADRLDLRAGSPGERNARALGSVLGQVLSRQGTDEAAGAEKNEVVCP